MARSVHDQLGPSTPSHIASPSGTRRTPRPATTSGRHDSKCVSQTRRTPKGAAPIVKRRTSGSSSARFVPATI